MTDWQQLAQLYFDNGSGPAYQIIEDVDPNANIRTNPGVALWRGVTADLELKPGTCTFRIGDDADRYRPSNAASDLYGTTGPYMRGAFATGGSVRFTGETQAMDPGQTEDMRESGGLVVRGDRWVDVTLGGPLARVGRWRDTLAAPLVTTITKDYGTNLRAYYPLQDGSNAAELSNLVARSTPGTFSGIRLAQANGPGGSDKVVEMTDTSTMTFFYDRVSASAGGWQLVFAVNTSAVDATLRDLFTWKTTAGHTWRFQASTSLYAISVEETNGANVVTTTAGHGAGADTGQWLTFRIKVTDAAGTVTIEPAWYPQTSGVFWGFTTSYSGTAGAPYRGDVVGNVATDGAAYGHHFLLQGISDNLVATVFTEAFNGYVTETTVERFQRLMNSRSLPYVVRGSTTMTMGIQPLVTFQDQLKEIGRTERGLIFDRGDNIGIVLCTLDYLYDQAADPVLDLTWPDDIAPPLAEDSDTSQIYNLITVTNREGASATAELDSGRLGTADPPDGAGQLDKKVDVNCATGGPLEEMANWWMRYYTQEGTRFSTVVIDVDAQPSLLTACNAAEPGMFMRITGRTPDPILLLILSTAQATHRKRNVFTFAVQQAEVFNAGSWDDGTTRWDSAYTSLDEDVTTTETGWDIVTDPPSAGWQTSTPYDWDCEGERVTVTSITVRTFSAGQWHQTATVTRSVNGVVKAHSSGATVRLADRRRWK